MVTVDHEGMAMPTAADDVWMISGQCRMVVLDLVRIGGGPKPHRQQSSEHCDEG